MFGCAYGTYIALTNVPQTEVECILAVLWHHVHVKGKTTVQVQMHCKASEPYIQPTLHVPSRYTAVQAGPLQRQVGSLQRQVAFFYNDNAR